MSGDDGNTRRRGRRPGPEAADNARQASRKRWADTTPTERAEHAAKLSAAFAATMSDSEYAAHMKELGRRSGAKRRGEALTPLPARPVPHGTNSGYAARGCRCEDCTAAHAAYQRDYLARRKLLASTHKPTP